MENEKSESNFMYCNQMQVAVSPWDLILTFQRVAPVTTGDAQVIDEVQVAMSPAHAKVALASMFESIEIYERTSGKIALDPDNQKRYDNFLENKK